MSADALHKVEELLTNLQPHIPQACYPGRRGFIDNYVDEALQVVRDALASRATAQAPNPRPEGFALVTRSDLRNLVDHVWGTAYESSQVPCTEMADTMIDNALGDDLFARATEPVAWRYRYGPDKAWKLADESGPQWAADHPGFEEEPLFAHPVLAGSADSDHAKGT